MSVELLNTSAPHGLRPGTTGFCTVGMTVGVTPALEERLTLLSGYRWLVPPGEKGAENNPVAFAHWRLMAGGRTVSVLSRVGDAGFDYSQRSNRFAHHIVLDPAEQVEAGPGWVMMQPAVMRTSWVGEPMVFEKGPEIPSGPNPPRFCQAWANAAGDAGWAGVLAGKFAFDPSRISCLIYPPGLDILPLIDEAIALLPAVMRWQVTFSTYFTELPAGMTCVWRCCAAGTRAAADAPRQANGGVLIDLTQPLPPPPDGPFVSLARGQTSAIEEPAQQGGAPALSSFLSSLQVFDLEAVQAVREELGRQNVRVEPQPPIPLLGGESGGEDPAINDRQSVDPSPPAPLPELSERARTAPYPWVEGDIANYEEPPPPARPGVSTTDPAKPSGRQPPGLFWMIAVAWPLIVAAGAIWFIHHRQSSFPPVARPGSVAAPQPSASVVPGPATAPAQAVNSVSLPIHNATTQKLESAQKDLDEHEKTIAQLRASLAEAKDELAVVKTRALAGAFAQAQLDKLKADIAQAQTQPTAATRPASPAIDRTVELFRDELELWPGDGNGPADSLLLESYQPPDGLLIEHSPSRIIFKSAATAPSDGPKPAPVQLAVIKIEGDRVVLEWITANRGQISSAVRAWMQSSRLIVQRQGNIVERVRFVAPRTTSINLEHETPASLLPDVHWKDAVKHVVLAVPDIMPPGWSAREKDPRTVTISNARVPDASFDVKLLVTEPGDVQAHTTFAAAFNHLRETATEQLTTSRNRAAVERSMQQIKELADATGTKAKDPAMQRDLDAAHHDLDAAMAAQRDAQAVHRAAEDALAELTSLPVLSLQVVNRDNGLVLCTLRIKRGQ